MYIFTTCSSVIKTYIQLANHIELVRPKFFPFSNFVDDYRHTDIHVPLHCQLQKILTLLNKLKHNTNKSTIAIDVWVTQNKLAELREEATELQHIIRTDLTKIIDLTSASKAQASRLFNSYNELKGKNAKLTDQCKCLQTQVSELRFEDVDNDMKEIETKANEESQKS